MISRRTFLGSATQLALGTCAISVSAQYLGLSPARAKVPEKIIIGQLPFNSEVTLYSGTTDFFRENGLAVEYLTGAGGPAVVQALASGNIPAGDIGVAPALIAAARGLPIVAPALGAIGAPSHPFDRIMVRKDSPIKTVSDLKGKRLALHQRGTMNDILLNALKKTHGVGPDDFEIAIIPAPNQPQVLEEKQVDAIYAVPPFDIIAERRFGARTLLNTSDFVPYLGYGTLALRRDFIEAYPDAAKGLMRSWSQLCRWIDDNAKAANSLAGEKIKVDRDVRDGLRLPYFARNGLPVIPNVWHIYYLLLAGKVLDPVDAPEKLIEQSVIEPTKRLSYPALQDIGVQKDLLVNDMLRASFPMLPKPVEAYQADWERELLRS